MDNLLLIIFSGLAGVIGTGIGGLIGVFLGKKSERTISFVLTFASGIMISISLFDLIPEAQELSGIWITSLGVILGVVIVSLLNYIIDRATQKNKKKVKTHKTLESLYHEEQLIESTINKKRLLKAGLVMLLAITLHNFPEGMAIGSSGSINYNLGFSLAILLAIHNIPEGMAMAVPLVAGGMKRLKTLLLIIFAGATTMLGGAFGTFVGGIGGITTALSVSFAAGAMLYVTFGEILPNSILMDKSRVSAYFAMTGLILGFIFTNIL